MNLDEELRAALRREDPSPGFSQRVVARAQSSPARKWAMPRLIWATAIAAMIVVGFAVTSEIRETRAERAGREAVLALRIAAEKLNLARDRVARAGRVEN